MNSRLRFCALWLAATLSCGVVSADITPRPIRAIGFSVATLENPFFGALIKGAEAQARSINPTVKFTVLANDYSVQKQITQVQRLIDDGVDLILLNAADPHQLADVTLRAKEAGIVVVALDVMSEGADITVLTDNHKAGEMACNYLANALNGKERVVIQSGPQVSSVIDRVAGCRSALRPFPGITLLGEPGDGKGSRWGGMQLMRDDLKRSGQFDGVFTINDRQAVGADTAARQAGLRSLVITSVDGVPDVEAALAGKTFIQASASQDPYGMAQRGVQLGADILSGHRPSTAVVLLEPGLVTRDNIKRYQGWNN
jgi:ribose transport system substrate-binding protein